MFSKINHLHLDTVTFSWGIIMLKGVLQIKRTFYYIFKLEIHKLDFENKGNMSMHRKNLSTNHSLQFEENVQNHTSSVL